MKKFIASLFVSIVALCWFSVADVTIPVTDLSWPTSCNSNETENINYYLTTSNVLSKKPYDVFGNTVDSLVWWESNGSSINIWKHGVISSCNTWNRISNVVSADDTNWALIFLNADNCVFNIPNYTKVSNPTDIDAQIHYTIWYRLIYNGWPNSITTRLYHRDFWVNNWTCYPGWNSVSNSDNCSQVTVKYWSQKYHTWECLNYRVFRCWDWLVNSPYGTNYTNWNFSEQCDPNDPNHVGWWSQWCSDTCQPLNQQQPICGNGIVEEWEYCDEWELNWQPWHCSSDCSYIVPQQPICGNGILEEWEYCDEWPLNWQPWHCNKDCTWMEPQQPICWNWIIEAWEQCEKINWQFLPWCENCQLLIPNCSVLHVDPRSWLVPLNVSFSADNISWISYTNLNFWDGSSVISHPNLVNIPYEQHSYTVEWTYESSITLTNNYNGPLATWITVTWVNCTIDITANQPEGTPELEIQKQLLDPNAIYHEWDYVWYEIILKNNWNATYYDAYILDVMPLSLDYVSSELIWTSSYTSWSWLGSNGAWNIMYSWFDLPAWEQVVLYLTWLIKNWASFNAATNCAFTSWDDSCVIIPTSPIPSLIKFQKTVDMDDFIREEITVNPWDYIVYKLEFGNVWQVSATWIVKDELPECITYVDSSIHGVTWANFVHDPDFTTIIYRDFLLQPWQTWYVIITWQVSDSNSCQNVMSYHNTWLFRFLSDNEWLKSDVIAVRPSLSGSIVLFDKTWNKSLLQPWEDIEFTLTVTNEWPNEIENVIVKDIWPDDWTCIEYKDWTWLIGPYPEWAFLQYLWNFSSPNRYEWKYWYDRGDRTNNNQWLDDPNSISVPRSILYAWESFSFKIFARVRNNPVCAWSYINTWVLEYDEWGKTHHLEDVHPFEVIGSFVWWSCKALTSPSNTIYLYDDDTVWSMDFTCHANWVANKIEINCGNGNSYSTTNASEFTHACTYTYNPNWNNEHNVTCTVNGDPIQNECSKKITLEYWWYGNCWNGILEPGEECDLKLVWWKVWIIWNYLDYEGQYPAGYYKWYQCYNCKIRNNGWWYVYEPTQCLQTDTPVSVMDNELLPFWWRLWDKKNNDNSRQIVSNYNCKASQIYTDGYDEKALSYAKNNWEKSSSSKLTTSTSTYLSNDGVTKIDKDSMICHFSVYNWKHWQWLDPITEFTGSCFNNNYRDSAIFNYFSKTHQTLNKASWRNLATVASIMNKLVNKEYWEYKLVLDKVEYNYCDERVWAWKPWKLYGWVCEVDFAVTKPYVVQVSTLWVTPIWSSNKWFMDDFFDMEWNKLYKKSDIADVLLLDNDSYAIPRDVNNNFESFKKKYEKLAIKITDNNVNDMFSAQNITSIKKVPGQSIYFIDWKWDLIIDQKSIAKTSPVYTIIVNGMDVHIKWNMLVTAMIVVDNWTIYFDDEKCQDGWQVVQWIFVALDWFWNKFEKLRNTNENKEFCPWWNLHVKWVLIWSWIDNISNYKRSQLNDWFTLRSSNLNDLKKERRKEIIEWASVLIEYSPSLWKILPPGAEMFTESLEVYKR